MESDERAGHSLPSAPAGAAAILAPVPLAQQPPQHGQYDFLVGSVIDSGALQRAGAEAARWGVTTHEALIAMGWLAPADYASALARYLDVAPAGWEAVFKLRTPEDTDDRDGLGLPATIAGRPCRVLCAESAAPHVLRRQAAALHARGMEAALATRSHVAAAIED
jgi:hypothetical protein